MAQPTVLQFTDDLDGPSPTARARQSRQALIAAWADEPLRGM